MQQLTEAQIIQLAPDASSVKAGKGLATPAKWVLLARSDRAVWGHCQGSGKRPYQTAVDLRETAFKCSCPSRKFPCKHGLGLLLLYAAHPELFSPADEPDWVTAWLAKREEKAEKKAEKEQQAQAKANAPVDEAAQAKRLAQRHQKVLNGIDDLETRLKDLLRNGLIHVPEQVPALFDNMARRLVDAQAPGLANRLRDLNDIDYTHESWKKRLTASLSQLYLLAQAYRHLDEQPEEWQAEIRTLVGYPQAREEVLATPPLTDLWTVLHHRRRTEGNLRTDIYWLQGQESRRLAYCLDFSAGPTGNATLNLAPGGTYRGSLCFYRGAGLIRRGLFQACELAEGRAMPTFFPNLTQAYAFYRQAVSANPFTDEVPLPVAGLRFARLGNRLCLQDGEGQLVPVNVDDSPRIDILAVTGGKAFSAFLLAADDDCRLCSIWYQSDFYTWKDERD